MNRKIFTDISEELWNDWQWQVKNRITTVEDLKKYIPLTESEEEGIIKCLQNLKNEYNSLLFIINGSRKS